MKIRKGFVSNSSSSSFIIKNDTHTIDSLYEKLQNMYIEMYRKNTKDIRTLKREFRNILYVIEINKTTNKKKTCDWLNKITYYGFADKHLDKNSYGLWIVSNGDNTIPYEFIEKIEHTFNTHHKFLG